MIRTLIATLLLSGCTVNGYEMERALANCSDHGGVHRLTYGPHKPFLVCHDGATP